MLRAFFFLSSNLSSSRGEDIYTMTSWAALTTPALVSGVRAGQGGGGIPGPASHMSHHPPNQPNVRLVSVQLLVLAAAFVAGAAAGRPTTVVPGSSEWRARELEKVPLPALLNAPYTPYDAANHINVSQVPALAAQAAKMGASLIWVPGGMSEVCLPATGRGRGWTLGVGIAAKQTESAALCCLGTPGQLLPVFCHDGGGAQGTGRGVGGAWTRARSLHCGARRYDCGRRCRGGRWGTHLTFFFSIAIPISFTHPGLGWLQELATHAHSIGADAIGSVPPYYEQPPSIGQVCGRAEGVLDQMS